MSGEANRDAPRTETDRDPEDASGDVIPVEVVPPQEGGTDDSLEAKIATLEREKKENWERYLRTAADLENFRKRQRRELDDARFEAKSKVLKEVLPVVDNLERAIEHATQQAAGSPIVEGVQLVLRQLLSAFERLDVTPIDAGGQPFDPNLHEAISQMDSEQPPGTVVQVLQRGYRAGDRLLRPALVVVAKAPAKTAE
ncbi:MAG TPA: nucleotide exchange factor GrpE [Kofleriaceae bacterium]|nr:nucleotide exchange factor GrpE [Kofleriaceae bacterium]